MPPGEGSGLALDRESDIHGRAAPIEILRGFDTFGPVVHALVTPRLRGLPLSEADFDDLHALLDERVLAAFGG
jgi:hypothetical protein